MCLSAAKQTLTFRSEWTSAFVDFISTYTLYIILHVHTDIGTAYAYEISTQNIFTCSIFGISTYLPPRCEHKCDRKDCQFNERARSQEEFYRFVVLSNKCIVYVDGLIRENKVRVRPERMWGSADVTGSHKLNKNKIYLCALFFLSVVVFFFLSSLIRSTLAILPYSFVHRFPSPLRTHTHRMPLNSFYCTLCPRSVCCLVMPAFLWYD